MPLLRLPLCHSMVASIQRCLTTVYVSLTSLLLCAVLYSSALAFDSPRQTHFNKLQEEFRIPRYGNGTGGELCLSKAQFTKTKHKPPLLPEKVR